MNENLDAIMNGMLIAIEGIDGAGKSTLAKILYDRLKPEDQKIYLTEEPQSNRPIGKLIRQMLKQEIDPNIDALLFAADRIDHCQNIQTYLEKGYVVITDRYKMSSIAYQTTQGCNQEWLMEINKYAPPADLNIFLDIDPNVAYSRLKGDLEKFETPQFLFELRHIYNSIINANNVEQLGQTLVIDAEMDYVDHVVELVQNTIDKN